MYLNQIHKNNGFFYNYDSIYYTYDKHHYQNVWHLLKNICRLFYVPISLNTLVFCAEPVVVFINSKVEVKWPSLSNLFNASKALRLEFDIPFDIVVEVTGMLFSWIIFSTCMWSGSTNSVEISCNFIVLDLIVFHHWFYF